MSGAAFRRTSSRSTKPRTSRTHRSSRVLRRSPGCIALCRATSGRARGERQSSGVTKDRCGPAGPAGQNAPLARAWRPPPPEGQRCSVFPLAVPARLRVPPTSSPPIPADTPARGAFACGVPGVITGTRVRSTRFDVDERPCLGNVLVCVAQVRSKRDGGHAATMRSRQGRARPTQTGPRA